MTPTPTENSYLLPVKNGDEDNDYGNDGDDENEGFPTLDRRRESFSQMKRSTHNDPSLSGRYASVEDLGTLLGSTSVLKNAIDRKLAAKEMNRKRSQTQLFTMALEVAPEASMEQESSQGSLRPQPNAVEYYPPRSSRTGSGYDSNSSSNSNSNTYYHQKEPPGFHESERGQIISRMSMVYQQQIQKTTKVYLKRIKKSFFEDAKSLAEGTIPQSIVLAIVIGIVCGIACYLYYSVLFFGLEYLWTTLPEQYVIPNWSPEYYWAWIPLVCGTMCTLVGLTVVYMGEPGDLPYTISRVHCEAYIPMDHVSPMVFASMFSILGGGSLGPEAPLVAICGALGGFVSRRIFRQSSTNVVRKHTFMGMAGALAAFFGIPLGGSLFALEVCSRFGVEYFEHLVESIFCGEICLMVFRSLSGLPIKPIWNFTSTMNPRMMECEPIHIILGAFIGLYGALLAYFFASFHWKNMEFFAKMNLLDNSRAVYRAWVGTAFIIIISLLVPHTAFWGEEEIQVVATMGPAKDLPNIWPPTGLIGFEMDSPFKVFIVGCCKLISISFTVAGGLRGGYIFPLMCSGAAFGRLLYFVLPETVPLQVVVLCTAAAMNVAITRTSLASTLILAMLPGEPMAIPPILMASLCSLFATSYMVRTPRNVRTLIRLGARQAESHRDLVLCRNLTLLISYFSYFFWDCIVFDVTDYNRFSQPKSKPFIKSQITRSDIDHSLFHEEHHIDVDSVFTDTDIEDELSL